MKHWKRIVIPMFAIIASSAVCVATTYALFHKENDTNIVVSSGKTDVTATTEIVELYSPTLIDEGVIVDDTNAATSTNFVNGGTATIVGGKLNLSNITLGDKATFKIVFDNKSNIHIKYRVMFYDDTEYTGLEPYKLIDALKIKEGENAVVNGYPVTEWKKANAGAAIDPITISVELPASSGVEYSGLSSNLRFTVEVVQGNVYTVDPDCAVNLVDNASGTLSETSFNVGFKKTLVIEKTNDNTEIAYFDFKVGDDILAQYVSTSGNSGYEFLVDGNPIGQIACASSIGTSLSYVILSNTTISIDGVCCVAEGTKITMGDLTKKNVEDLRNGDEIMGYNFFTGQYESRLVNYVMEDENYGNKFEIKFENGNSVTIFNSEDMFDVNTKEFFTVSSETYKNIVGRTVLLCDNGVRSSSKIISVTKELVFAKYYTVYSCELINYVANDVLMVYAVSGFNQRYTVDENFKIDMDAYNSDVSKYGLFTYEDFPELSKHMFDNFDIATVSFIIGKGYITLEEAHEMNRELVWEYTYKRPLFLSK